ncbi:MAG: carboxypeptidase-like regulatory domain-containing protein, partial [Bacteroidales bacterium]|nr:carboxypeptidase-like regulatory domain-containing protein [Bacteroidales bacterium]
MGRKILLLAFGLLVMVFGYSQSYTISGRVLDSQSGQTLAFVNIVANNSRAGTSTDIDGRFTITANEEIEFLRLSYVGYAQATFYPQGKAQVEILMEPLPVT